MNGMSWARGGADLMVAEGRRAGEGRLVSQRGAFALNWGWDARACTESVSGRGAPLGFGASQESATGRGADARHGPQDDVDADCQASQE